MLLENSIILALFNLNSTPFSIKNTVFLSTISHLAVSESDAYSRPPYINLFNSVTIPIPIGVLKTRPAHVVVIKLVW